MDVAGMLKRWRPREGACASSEDAQAGACQTLSRELHLPAITARLLVQRGLTDPPHARQFLDPKLTDLDDPISLPGVEQAAARLEQAVRDGQPIVIYGDYDVDGITASAILWHTLTAAGAVPGSVSTYVPHRLEEGYGLNDEAIRQIAIHAGAESLPGAKRQVSETLDKVSPPLIITVDCGITAVAPAKIARELGIDLIITDHHELDPANLPAAHTLVHPRLPTHADAESAKRLVSSKNPKSEIRNPKSSEGLCGAGVAFKLAWHFARVHCGSQRLPADFRRVLLDLVSLAALGTIADVVPLLGENRIITAIGLGQIKRTSITGLNALIDAARLRDEKIDAYHVGFVLGPRLNACGRMGHAREAVKLLTDATPAEARTIAAELTQENDRRRTTERSIFAEAAEMVRAQGYDRADCRAIVVGKEGWHAGVVGIVASRLVDAFCRPAVVLNFDNGQAHGSARSVDGLSIHEAFAHCQEHLTTWGGHAMAAGLRMETARVEVFRQALVAFVNARLEPRHMVGCLDIDADCTLAELNESLYESIRHLAPFGRANPTPVFRLCNITLARPPLRIGKQGAHLSLTLEERRKEKGDRRQETEVRSKESASPRLAGDAQRPSGDARSNRLMRAIWFNAGTKADQLAVGMRLDVAAQLKTSTWQGRTQLDIVVQDVRVLD
ncbi:MAG: single-stranded-DNA-specific exonuclease RecJ [Phycisphaeraceae bacterium]